ncbi:site-2 protease family protein [Aneurinibacillus uraniidurans]|uniref:site-2 protease family protein n=1 Tax=Aneurinibacillus uraniidurans TaxID=2966586 RepID=UPI003BEF44E7
MNCSLLGTGENGLFNFDLNTLLFRIIAFVIAFTVHEWAHAFVAYKLGDPTAKNEGRLTLNPISHVDPFGMLLILFGPFGWARPVPFNAFHFRGNRRLGVVWVSLAGPLMNLLLAFLFMGAMWVLATTNITAAWPDWATRLVGETVKWSFMINVALFVFNMLPIAPLDGSKILRYLLPHRFDRFFDKIEPYGTFALLLLVFLPGLGFLIYQPYKWVMGAMLSLLG